MAKQMTVGSIFMQTAAETQQAAIEMPPGSPFRILILANFSGQPNGELARPIAVDRDSFDDMLAKISPRLSLMGINPDGSPGKSEETIMEVPPVQNSFNIILRFQPFTFTTAGTYTIRVMIAGETFINTFQIRFQDIDVAQPLAH